MDPVQQTLAQQNSGSANGEGFGQFFVEGRRQGLMKRQLDLQEKQEERLQERQDMLLPLEAQQNRLQNANLGIAAVSNLRKGIVETQINAAGPELLQLQIDFARAPDGFMNEKGYEDFKNIIRRYPALMQEGMPGAKIANQIMGARLNEARLDQTIKQFKKFKSETGEMPRTINPTTGAVTMQSDNWSDGEDNGPELRTANGVVFRRNSTGGWTPLPARLEAPTTMKVTDAVTGQPISILQTGPNSFSRVTPSPAQNEVEKTEVTSANIFEKGRQLLPLINDRTTGIRGGLQRALRDSGIGLVFPSYVDPQVSEADAVAREFAADLVRGMRSDSNINEKEQQGLASEANTLRWVDEKTGKTRLATFVKGAASKAREASLRLGRPINEKYLTWEELLQRAEAKIEAGEMTKEQAVEWTKRNWNNSAAFMLEEINKSLAASSAPKK